MLSLSPKLSIKKRAWLFTALAVLGTLAVLTAEVWINGWIFLGGYMLDLAIFGPFFYLYLRWKQDRA